MRRTIFSLRPTWGLSLLRDRVTATGSGSAVSEVEGQLLVKTGAVSGAVAQLATVQRGQYAAGQTGEVGVAVRIPVAPVGDQVITWGYFDTLNGFGFRYDASGLAVFRRKNGIDEVVRQSDWNIDRLTGDGPSGTTLVPANGNIYQIRFTWYGYGSIEFSVQLAFRGMVRETVTFHRINVGESTSITDPNQPLTVRVDNGSATSSLEVYVGGRQLSLVGGAVEFQQREFTEVLSTYSLTSSWTPLVAVREKAIFGPSGRPNSVSSKFDRVKVVATDRCEFKVMYGGTVGGTFYPPTEVPPAETACETIVQTGTLTYSGGVAFGRFAVAASSQQAENAVVNTSELFLDSTNAVTVLGRNTAGGAETVNVFVTWTEQW